MVNILNKIQDTQLMNEEELKQLLDEKALTYNHPNFIETDPIQIPHRFAKKENIEISGFLAASIAWGQRATIIKNGLRLVAMMDNDPYQFLMQTDESEWLHFSDFKHRTYNGTDCLFFIRSLKNIYQNHGGLETVFTKGYQQENSIASALRYFRTIFFEVDHQDRSQKHISNIDKGASAKRLNMFLRWMVREDKKGVDFGLWKAMPMSDLLLPLDVHTGTIGRQLGLLNRRQDNWRSVIEITESLRRFDPKDPIKYDFALFGMGAFE